MKVMLVCSPGGHLQQMISLREAWQEAERLWVTLPGADVDYLLRDEEVILGFGPTNRSIVNLIRNLPLAWRSIRAHRPEAILSTGAGLALPFFLVGKMFGLRLIYVESLTRIESISLTGRLVYPLATRFFVQWPAAARHLKRAEYKGSVL